MNHIFILAETSNSAHYHAEILGFTRGQYQVVVSYDKIRGMRGCTMFVVPRAETRDDFTRIHNGAIMSEFTIIYIDDDDLDIIEGIGYTEA